MTFKAALLSFAGLLAVACSEPRATPDVAIVNVTIVDSEHGTLLPGRTVLLRAGRILRVDSGSAQPLPRRTQRIDGTDRFLVPGFWDMHVHLAGNDGAAPRMLAWGITGVRDMGGDLEQIVTLRQRIAAGQIPGPRLVIAGLALGGPGSPAAAGLGIVRTPQQAAIVVDSLARRGVDFIKVHEDLSPQTWFAISRRARLHGLALAGHVPASMSPEQASDSGLHSFEHFEYLPDRCLVLLDSVARANHRLPPVGCRPAEIRRLMEHLRANGAWLCPTLSSFRGWAPKQWPGIQAGFADLATLIRTIGLPLLAGTDFGDPRFSAGESLHDELELLVAAGFSSAAVLRAATYSPAVFLGLTDSLGTVKPGHIADLVLLNGNPFMSIRNTRRIAAVIQHGALVDRNLLLAVPH